MDAKRTLDGEKRAVFDMVSIGLASPETIRSWSFGEVKNPETINYRTYKPERGGLFCERIFGPQRDWECSCGKYKRVKHKGVVCDRCGVEVTLSRVRRSRMAHIELAVPVSHIWFFKCAPSRLGIVLDLSSRVLERILYYEDYIVVDAGKTPLHEAQVLREMEYREAQEKYPDEFVAKTGAEALRDLMKKMDLDKIITDLETQMITTRSQQTRKKLAKRLKVFENMRLKNLRPEWMILDVLPVIPPDLRPLVPLEGGRFATSDLNDLYRRVINRNNRLKNLLMLKTPDVIISNEKRMLQEAVDALLDNGRHGRAVIGTGNRPLKSISDMLKGKQGRFRQNLLGKRVDYSGRSVIVVGPELALHQCGLPKKMALVLFEPFVINRLKEKGIVHTIRGAKKMMESQTDEVWDALDEVVKGKTVMLNRAPTLHRLSIQSFEPVLIEGEAIQIHPLVCTAFNADFDGDQMAVHVPLSIEAQLESRLLMLSTNNLFSPSSGKPILTPTQDIALGIYYLTLKPVTFRDKLEEGVDHLPIFENADEVRLAYDLGDVKIHTQVLLRNPDWDQNRDLPPTAYGRADLRVVSTTVGRVFFNSIFPKPVGFINEPINKKMLSAVIWKCYHVAGHQETIRVLDRIKEIGFEHATLAGVSIGLTDMIMPEAKDAIIAAAREQVKEVDKQYRVGVITEGERYNKIIDIWASATEEISNRMYEAIRRNNGSPAPNSLFMMVDSGARGSRQQVRQLAGMRGLMAKPSGEIIEQPIISNFRRGLSVLEYFISTHGARKGLADTALKTADAGYLTRKLVDVAQDVIITEQDCNTLNGIEVQAISGVMDISLASRIVGRTALEDIRDPNVADKEKAVLVPAGHDISEAAAEKIEEAGIDKVKIRSVLTCESRRGVCAKCYGRDLTTDRAVELGTAAGIIAAQSIGEPGTQLTMRTFHIGGTASSRAANPQIVARNGGVIAYKNARMVKDTQGNLVVLNKNAVAVISGEAREPDSYSLVVGTILPVPEGGTVAKGQVFARWEPHSVPIIAEQSGVVHFHDFVENVSVKVEVDVATGLKGMVVLDYHEDIQPQILIKDAASGETLRNYSIPAGAYVVVTKGSQVQAGTVLAKTPRKEAKTRDITGGLPRVAELFEARRPKGAAEISKIAGIVSFGPVQRNGRHLIVRDPVTGGEEEHIIPLGRHIIVFDGDRVEKGEPLTEGPVVPQEILEICGPQALQEYLVNEVQEVYRLQGVEINDKHIEVIVRQMLKKVRITDSGETELMWGELVDKNRFQEINQQAMADGKRPAEASPAILGVTKASLETESFISAASFQDTTRVLTEAAVIGKTDKLFGFKENVIMGHLIPAGVGFSANRQIKLVPLTAPIAEDVDMPESTEFAKNILE